MLLLRATADAVFMFTRVLIREWCSDLSPITSFSLASV
jgi:hypothetical protein